MYIGCDTGLLCILWLHFPEARHTFMGTDAHHGWKIRLLACLMVSHCVYSTLQLLCWTFKALNITHQVFLWNSACSKLLEFNLNQLWMSELDLVGTRSLWIPSNVATHRKNTPSLYETTSNMNHAQQKSTASRKSAHICIPMIRTTNPF